MQSWKVLFSHDLSNGSTKLLQPAMKIHLHRDQAEPSHGRSYLCFSLCLYRSASPSLLLLIPLPELWRKLMPVLAFLELFRHTSASLPGWLRAGGVTAFAWFDFAAAAAVLLSSSAFFPVLHLTSQRDPVPAGGWEPDSWPGPCAACLASRQPVPLLLKRATNPSCPTSPHKTWGSRLFSSLLAPSGFTGALSIFLWLTGVGLFFWWLTAKRRAMVKPSAASWVTGRGLASSVRQGLLCEPAELNGLLA